MKQDCIFIFFGGTMSGIFGAGVVTALQELNFYNRVHSIYAISAGAHNAAYFLAKDTKLGASIYYEDLIDNRFIMSSKLKFLFEFIFNVFTNKAKIENLVDIDYLIDVEKNKKKLETEKISKSQIDFFIRCFNIDSKKEEYLDGKKDILKKLQATSAVVPFYPKLVNIKNKRYSDGDTLSKIIDPFLEKIIDKNNDKKIYLIFNNPVKNRNSIKSIVGNFFWTILLFCFFRKVFVLNKLNIISEMKKLQKYCKKPNINIIEPDFNFSPFCTNKSKLLELYSHGIEKTKKIIIETNLIPKSN